ncbi:MAG: hypothetical protein ACK5RO_02605 [Pseudobdellovibrionaceae bacterium]
MSKITLFPLLNQRGSILLQAMGVTLVVGIVSGIMLTQSQNVSKQTLVPRVKSSMAKVEQRLSEAVMTPEAFTCTGSGVATCTLNSDYLLQFSLPVGGTDCANPPCRAVIDPATLVMDAATKKVRASIVYEGDSIPIKPISFEVDIPSEILQLATTRCPASSPLFRGFTATGEVKCDPLPAACGNDQFLTSVERSTLTPNCTLIPEAPDCPTDQLVSRFEWRASGVPDVQCSGIIRPSTFFSHSMDVATTPAVRSVSGGGGGPPPTSPPTTAAQPSSRN